MLYLWGCLLGTILLFLSWKFFKPALPIPSWLPASLVVDRINKYHLIQTEKLQCFLNCYKITEAEILNIINQKDIDYKNSDVRKKPWPSYNFSGTTTDNRNMQICVEVPDSLPATIIEVKMDSVMCNCD